MKHMKRIGVLAFALALVLALAGCGGNAASSASSSASEQGASAAASSVAADGSNSGASTAAQASEPVGKPWVTSVLLGNLPAEAPALKDDLYAHYNYDFLAAHQAQGGSTMADHAKEVPAAITEMIKGSSKTGHDFEQLRLFYEQATDIDALQKTGFSEVQPYLDRIDAVTSIDEMNALLKAEDFPFSPFIEAYVSVNDTRGENIVAISANLMFFDALSVGGAYYQQSDDQQAQGAMNAAVQAAAGEPVLELAAAGYIETREDLQATAKKLIDFEKAHGQYVDYTAKYMKADYGVMAELARDSYFTLDEAAALAPNFPLKETLDKLGKSGSSTYALSREWLESFNGLWTNDNIDVIKLVAKTKVLCETHQYRDPTTFNNLLESFGLVAQDAETFAYNACGNLNTFSHVMAKAYVDDVLGQQAKERLTTLSQDLVNTYKDLVSTTTWLGEESQQRIIEKLDHMTLNILEPQGGYFDFSDVQLTPTDQGGTLFSNYLKLKQHRYDCESKLIGQPALASTPWWGISPLTPNAFYDATSNSINILPGGVTSLAYRDDMDDAELLACSGFTLGHEISHSFDYLQSQIDAYGQPNPVYADADVDSFVLKSSTLALYYSGIEMKDGLNVDGQAVVGEATADLCGMQANLELAAKTEGFDYDKYFRSLANMWAGVLSEPELQMQTIDIHPINNLRVNVSAQMLDPIYSVFGVAEGDGMYLAPEQRIIMWGPNA